MYPEQRVCVGLLHRRKPMYPEQRVCVGNHGGLAQLARAPALQAGGQRFESVILHSPFRGYEVYDMLEKQTKPVKKQA